MLRSNHKWFSFNGVGVNYQAVNPLVSAKPMAVAPSLPARNHPPELCRRGGLAEGYMSGCMSGWLYGCREFLGGRRGETSNGHGSALYTNFSHGATRKNVMIPRPRYRTPPPCLPLATSKGGRTRTVKALPTGKPPCNGGHGLYRAGLPQYLCGRQTRGTPISRPQKTDARKHGEMGGQNARENKNYLPE